MTFRDACIARDSEAQKLLVKNIILRCLVNHSSSLVLKVKRALYFSEALLAKKFLTSFLATTYLLVPVSAVSVASAFPFEVNQSGC